MNDASRILSSQIPAEIAITCFSNKQPQSGILLRLTLNMTDKNHHEIVLEPSDQDGKITIQKDQIIRQAEENLRLFPMDYQHPQTHLDSISINPMNRDELQAALMAVRIFGEDAYQPNYKQNLQEALKSTSENPPTILVSIKN